MKIEVGQIWVDESRKYRTVVYCDGKKIKYTVGKSSFIFDIHLVTFMLWTRDWTLKNKPVMNINKKALEDL